MQKTLANVGENNVRTWTGQYGAMSSIKVQFTDGEVGEVNCKQQNQAATLARLKGMVGKPNEFEVLDGGTFPSGEPKPKKVKLPQAAAAGGGAAPARGAAPSAGGANYSGYVPRFRDTPEGFAIEQASIHRSVALAQAVEFNKGDAEATLGTLLEDARQMHDWLMAGVPKPAPPAAAPAPAQAEQPKPVNGQAQQGGPQAWQQELADKMNEVYPELDKEGKLAKCSYIVSSVSNAARSFKWSSEITAADAKMIMAYLAEQQEKDSIPF